MTQPQGKSLFDLAVTSIDGDELLLANYEGHVLYCVVVDVHDELADQLYDLESVFDEFYMRGFFVLALPTNQFNGRDDDNDAIADLLRDTYDVNFPILAVSDVAGDQASEIAQLLTDLSNQCGDDDPATSRGGDITAGFEKFVISPTGELLGRFGPAVDVDDDVVVSLIDRSVPVQ